jgi:membrane protease YdiL (CAAX protease family)
VTSEQAPRQIAASCPIAARAGAIGFVGTWLCAAFASSIPLVVFAETGEPVTVPVLAVSLLLGWITFLVGATLTSRSHGSGDVVADLGITVRPVDVIGLPIGILSQVALVPLVYEPLRAIWPATFSDEALTETAKDLVDRADGLLLPLLIVLVVFGAPVVEEIVYRGLLQRPLLNEFSAALVIVVVAAVFALIHFRPVEYPGLFIVGLVFGVCAWWTGRVGMAIAAHIGFNVTGIAFAL